MGETKNIDLILKKLEELTPEEVTALLSAIVQSPRESAFKRAIRTRFDVKRAVEGAICGERRRIRRAIDEMLPK